MLLQTERGSLESSEERKQSREIVESSFGSALGVAAPTVGLLVL